MRPLCWPAALPLVSPGCQKALAWDVCHQRLINVVPLTTLVCVTLLPHMCADTQERKAVSKQGLTIKRLLGSEVSSSTWDKVSSSSSSSRGRARLRHVGTLHASSSSPAVSA